MRRLAHLHHHVRGIGSPDAQLEATQPELHRVAERRASDEGDLRSLQQPHLAQSHRDLLIGWE